MHMPEGKMFLDAIVLGIELAVVAVIAEMLYKYSPVKLPAEIEKYKFFVVAIILLIIGLFAMPKLMFHLAEIFIAIQIMFIVIGLVQKR